MLLLACGNQQWLELLVKTPLHQFVVLSLTYVKVNGINIF